MRLKLIKKIIASTLIFSMTFAITTTFDSKITIVQANETVDLSSYLKNVYSNIFGREIDQQGLEYWSQKLSTREISLINFFKNLLSEDEFNEIANTIELKIEKLYAGIFQRTPDQSGFEFWSSKYKEKLKEVEDEKEALKKIIDDMTNGNEFKEILDKLGLNSNKTTIDNEILTNNTSNSQNSTEIPNEYKAVVTKAMYYGEKLNMSKKGIYDQLTSPYGEQFTEEEAQYAIDNIQIDWKANALVKAEYYGGKLHMSKKAVYDQLISPYGEQFTEEEAQYAVDNVKIDWKANALTKAQYYQTKLNMSKKAIYDQLISQYGEQFTEEEAQYAIDNL